MGLDDRNEGNEPGACLEHEWVFEHIDLAATGGYIYQRCKWCATVTVTQP